MAHRSRFTDQRLASLYDGEGFGGEKTMRARVIRELIDEIRLLRQQVGELAMLFTHACRHPTVYR